MTCITDDLKHDSLAARAFYRAAEDHLETERGATFTRTLQHMDQCAAQYKSVAPFYDVSVGCGQRSYFGTGHGKGLSDGEGAVLKTVVTKMVKSRTHIVRNAEDMYNALQVLYNKPGSINELNHNARTVLLMNNIVREERPSLRTVRGTRDLHEILGVADGVICARDLTCYCDSCLNNPLQAASECSNSLYVTGFREHHLLSANVQGTNVNKTKKGHKKAAKPEATRRQQKTDKAREALYAPSAAETEAFGRRSEDADNTRPTRVGARTKVKESMKDLHVNRSVLTVRNTAKFMIRFLTVCECHVNMFFTM